MADLKTPGFGQVPANSLAVDARRAFLSLILFAFARTAAACAAFPAGIARGDGKAAATTVAVGAAPARLVERFLAIGDGAAEFADADRMRLDRVGH